MEEQLKKLSESVIEGRKDDAARLTQELLAGGVLPEKVLNDGLIAAMSTVGEMFKNCEIYLPEMLMSARAMKAATEILRPLLVQSGIKPAGTVIIGTVQGDLHDIGKNLVGMMAEGAGFKVIDLGVDVPPAKFVEAVRQNDGQIIGMSALLTTTMMRMPEVIKTLEQEGIRDKVRVIVGGAAITQEWANEIGADGYAPDAASAADKCKELIAGMKAA